MTVRLASTSFSAKCYASRECIHPNHPFKSMGPEYEVEDDNLDVEVRNQVEEDQGSDEDKNENEDEDDEEDHDEEDDKGGEE